MGALNQILLSISNLSSIEFCLMSESLIETLALACKNFIEVNFLFELLRAFFGDNNAFEPTLYFNNEQELIENNNNNFNKYLLIFKFKLLYFQNLYCLYPIYLIFLQLSMISFHVLQ